MPTLARIPISPNTPRSSPPKSSRPPPPPPLLLRRSSSSPHSSHVGPNGFNGASPMSKAVEPVTDSTGPATFTDEKTGKCKGSGKEVPETVEGANSNRAMADTEATNATSSASDAGAKNCKPASRSQNKQTPCQEKYPVKYIGVKKCKSGTKYESKIRHNSIHYYKYHVLASDAALEYDTKAKELKGESYKVNFASQEEYEAAKRREIEWNLNSKSKPNIHEPQTQLIGVSKAGSKYRAQLNYKCITHNLGNHTLAVDAALAYDHKAKELKGKHCRVNFASMEEYDAAKQEELEWNVRRSTNGGIGGISGISGISESNGGNGGNVRNSNKSNALNSTPNKPKQKMYSDFIGVTRSKNNSKYKCVLSHEGVRPNLEENPLAVGAALACDTDDTKAKEFRGAVGTVNSNSAEEYEGAKRNEMEWSVGRWNGGNDSGSSGSNGSNGTLVQNHGSELNAISGGSESNGSRRESQNCQNSMEMDDRQPSSDGLTDRGEEDEVNGNEECTNVGTTAANSDEVKVASINPENTTGNIHPLTNSAPLPDENVDGNRGYEIACRKLKVLEEALGGKYKDWPCLAKESPQIRDPSVHGAWACENRNTSQEREVMAGTAVGRDSNEMHEEISNLAENNSRNTSQSQIGHGWEDSNLDVSTRDKVETSSDSEDDSLFASDSEEETDVTTRDKAKAAEETEIGLESDSDYDSLFGSDIEEDGSARPGSEVKTNDGACTTADVGPEVEPDYNPCNELEQDIQMENVAKSGDEAQNETQRAREELDIGEVNRKTSAKGEKNSDAILGAAQIPNPQNEASLRCNSSGSGGRNKSNAAASIPPQDIKEGASSSKIADCIDIISIDSSSDVELMGENQNPNDGSYYLKESSTDSNASKNAPGAHVASKPLCDISFGPSTDGNIGSTNTASGHPFSRKATTPTSVAISPNAQSSGAASSLTNQSKFCKSKAKEIDPEDLKVDSIWLDEFQSEQTRYPMGCLVSYPANDLDGAYGIGVVVSVWINVMARQSIYEIVACNSDGDFRDFSTFMLEDNLAYSPGCSIFVSLSALKIQSREIPDCKENDGIIAGKVMLSKNHDTDSSPEIPTTYTVMICSEERPFHFDIVENVPQNSVSFRKIEQNTPSPTNENNNALEVSKSKVTEEEIEITSSSLNSFPSAIEIRRTSQADPSLLAEPSMEDSAGSTLETNPQERSGIQRQSSSSHSKAHSVGKNSSSKRARRESRSRKRSASRSPSRSRSSTRSRGRSRSSSHGGVGHHSRTRYKYCVEGDRTSSSHCTLQIPLWLVYDNFTKDQLQYHLDCKTDVGRRNFYRIRLMSSEHRNHSHPKPSCILIEAKSPNGLRRAYEEVEDAIMNFIRDDGSKGRLQYEMALSCTPLRNMSARYSVCQRNPFSVEKEYGWMNIVGLPYTIDVQTGEKHAHAAYILSKSLGILSHISQQTGCTIKICGNGYRVPVEICEPYVWVWGREAHDVDDAVDILRDCIRNHTRECQCFWRESLD